MRMVFLWLVLIQPTLTFPLLAQTTIGTGSIVGTVSDPSGAVISGAKVSITNTATGQVINLMTNSSGTFYSGALIPGNYMTQFSTEGFSPVEVTATVLLGNAATVNVTLQIRQERTVISVQDSAAIVNTEQPAVQGVLNELQIENLPVNGRNFLDLAQLEPGVQIQDGASLGFGFKDGYSSISFGGRFGRTERIEVDGIDISDERFGSSTANIPASGIQEFQLSQSSFDLSTELTTSGAVNVTTRSGTNNWFWSPDSASVGFFADGKMKRIDIVGGAPLVLANAVVGRGGAWSREGIIMFASAVGPLLKVPATGGEPAAVTRLEAGQSSHRFPQFFPDGRHFIYFVQGAGQGVYAASLDGTPPKRLANADAAAVLSPSGFLLFARQTTLFAQAFDLKRQELSGNPFPVTEQTAFDATLNLSGFSAVSGIVAYRTGAAGGTRQLTWLDRSGKKVGTVGALDSAGLTDVELSPDGKRAAVHRAVNGNTDIWLIDAARGVPTRFTYDVAADQRPIWSSDGSRVVFQSSRKGGFNLYTKLSSGTGADELLLESDQAKAPADWSSDGRFLLFRSLDPQTGYDLWVLPTSGDKKPFPFLKTSFEERDGQFSPGNQWIAYQSNESGRFEIYVQPFPGPGAKFQISTNGGAQPRWNKNGKEIYLRVAGQQDDSGPGEVVAGWAVAGNGNSGGAVPRSYCWRPPAWR
jgi:Tol biopolymer transport system component